MRAHNGAKTMGAYLQRTSFLGAITVALVLVAGPARAADKAESKVNAFTGTFETTVPIGVPEFLGLEPKLGLLYNSGSPNGRVGVGWNLGGFSMIERASRGGGAPRYDANDVYYLDGNLLLTCAEAAANPSCSSGGTHATYIETFARIKYVTGNDTWEVTKRDGTKLTYVVHYPGPGGTFRYGLSSVADRAGNTVSYAYWCETNADCYPDTVSYNGVQVKLYWEVRPDPIKSAIGGGYMATTNYRVKTVDVVVNGGRARSYKLTYDTYQAPGAPPISKLTAIQQFGRDATLDGSGTVTGGSSLPAMTMAYDGQWWPTFVRSSGTFPTHNPNFGFPPSGSHTMAPGDFDGDGKTDVAMIQSTGLYVLFSNGDGTLRDSWFAFNNGWAFGYPPSANYTLVVGDFNGDGKTDIDLLGATTHHLMLSNGDGTFALSQPAYPGWNFGTPISAGYTLAVGDFDGDGKIDIDLMGESPTSHYMMRSNGDGSFTYSVTSANGWGFGSPPHNGYTLAVGDFNGDGKADIDLLGAQWHHLMLSNGDGSFSYSAPSYPGWNFTTPIPNYYTVATGDFNGDGKTDIDILGATNHYLMLSNGASFSYSSPSYGGWNFGTPPTGYAVRPTQAATYNPVRYGCTYNGATYGDNSTCLANCNPAFTCTNQGNWTLAAQLSGGGPISAIYNEWWGSFGWQQNDYYIGVSYLYVHNNCMANIYAETGYTVGYHNLYPTTLASGCYVGEGQTNTHLVCGGGWVGYEEDVLLYDAYAPYGNLTVNYYQCPYTGAICGCSKTCNVQFACQPANEAYYSCPSGWELSGTTCYGPAPRGSFNLVVGDFNGDGKTDIDMVGGTYHYLMLGNADGSFTNANSGISHGGWDFGTPPDAAYAVAPGDFDGDGKMDFTMIGGPYYYMTRSGAGSSRLVTLDNGQGASSTIGYVPSSAWPDNQLPDGAVFPTVASVTTHDGQGGSLTTTYTYRGARWKAGTVADPVRSFLGFRKATTTLAETGAYSETYFWQRVGTFARPEAIYKRRADGALLSFDLLSFTENASPPYTTLATQASAYECNGSAVFDGQGNYVSGCRRVVMTYTYDQYGNMTEERHYGDYDLTGDERTISRSFAPNTSAYVVGLPAWENVYTGIGTGGTLVNATKYYYDGATSTATAPTVGLLTKKGVWNDQTGTDVASTFAYDAHGRETAVTDPLGRTATRVYSTAGFVTSIADPLGRTVETTWDTTLGVPLNSTDVNGEVTTHGYDTFGRGTLTTKPDGAQTKVEYLDFGTATQRVRTSVLLPGNQWVWEDAYSDALGRPRKVVSSTGVISETLYGPTGGVWKQSLPYVTGETVRWEERTYDDVGREVSTTFPDGAVGTRAYGNGWVTTTDPGGTVRTSWFDAYGRVTQQREVIDGSNADASFSYDVMGRRTKSVDPLGKVTLVVFDSLGRAVQKSDPDQGLWHYAYDLAGRLTAETDARNQTTTLGYDALGRVTRRTYADASHDDYTFDETGRGASLGRMTTSVSATGVTTRAWYDVLGRRTRYEQVVDGQTNAVSHTYDVAGRLVTETYPDGEVVTYTYGTSGLATGKLVGMSGSVAGSLLSSVSYTARGKVAALTYGNGVTTTTGYDAIGERVASLQIGSLATITYGYDGLGRMTSQASTHLRSTNWTYAYDGIGRLTRATNTTDSAYSATYRYDLGGRIVCNSESSQGAYTYGDAAHPHAVTAAGANTYAYDANGNMTSGAGRLLAYDLAHRPASISSGGLVTDFVYDAQGVRVKKSSANGTVVYVGGLYEARGGEVVKHYLAGGMRVAKRDANGTSFVHTDHLGSTRLLTNASGQEVQHYDYMPYGRLLVSSGGVGHTRRFTGQESDDETGLIFFQARYYDPALGRFIQPDSFVPDLHSPQALDLYAYANNNPINYVDPSGNWAAAGAVVNWLLSSTIIAGISNLVIVGTWIIGTALTFSKNPFLQSLGMILGAMAGAAIFGGPSFFSGEWGPSITAGIVAAATSPISPLGATFKQIIGWAYNFWGLWDNMELLGQGKTPNGLAKGAEKIGITSLAEGTKWLSKALGNTVLGNLATLAVGEVALTAFAWGVAYVSSGFGTAGRQIVAFVARAFIIGTAGSTGPLGFVGSTFDLVYSLRYPDGRVIDLSGGEGGEAFTFYHYQGLGSPLSYGRQHIRVGDPAGGFWELGDTAIGHFGSGSGWAGFGATHKVTVILSPSQAASFRGALQKGAEGGGRYMGYHRDSYYYPSAALEFATGKSAADLHINPGLIHW